VLPVLAKMLCVSLVIFLLNAQPDKEISSANKMIILGIIPNLASCHCWIINMVDIISAAPAKYIQRDLLSKVVRWPLLISSLLVSFVMHWLLFVFEAGRAVRLFGKNLVVAWPCAFFQYA
jgi:hypothetical protein